jgi:hypothetical protein
MKKLDLAPDISFEDGRNWNILGIMADNREEWIITLYACFCLEWTISPFYEVQSFGSP